MTSRLRRILLINTKTSGTHTSGIISQIDPRGGAAVTGHNGAGKTTTLQVVPLFFGHSPSQISHPGSTREPMLRFMLPEPQCAIAFEYQRGDDEADVRLVVLRRQDNTDAPEYRFFATPFRDDLFIQDLPGGGGAIFLDDAGSVDAATRLQIDPGAKHSAPQYRSIILNQRSLTKNADTLRRIARQFSFSDKPLPHLDRLVAAVMKPHVDFKDFTSVAVTMVFEQMGGTFTDPNTPGHKLTVRQGKEQIDRWLKNRDACERAVKVSPEVDTLREMLHSLRKTVIEARELRGDVLLLNRMLIDRQREKNGELETLIESRDAEVEQLAGKGERLADQEESALNTFKIARGAYDTIKAQRDFLTENDAPHWAKEASKLPVLKDLQTQIEAQIETLESQAAGISRRYESEIARLDTRTAETAEKMLGGKGANDLAYQGEIKVLTDQENTAAGSLSDEHREALESQQEVVSERDAALGEARARLSHPVVGSGIVSRKDEAQRVSKEHGQALTAMQMRSAVTKRELSEAIAEFDEADQHLADRRDMLTKAHEALERVNTQLMPAEGTLHAALLKSSDPQWKATIARVIDERLLLRTDLHPTQIEDASAGLYGWAMTLDGVATPDWTNEDTLRRHLAEVRSRIEDAAAATDAARQRLETAATALDKARSEDDEVSALLAVLFGKSAGIEFALSEALEAYESAQKQSAYEAKQSVDAITAQCGSAHTQLRAMRAGQTRAVEALAREFQTAREQALQRRNVSDGEIDTQIALYKEAQGVRRKQLESERDAELKGQGVDVGRISELRKELKPIVRDIGAINDRLALIAQWNEWIQSNGAARLNGLKVEFDQASSQKEVAEAALREHTLTVTKRASEFTGAKKRLDDTISWLTDELRLLLTIDNSLRDYTPISGSNVSSDTHAKSLNGRLDGILAAIRTQEHDIEAKARKIENQLYSHESSVKDFVMMCLEDLGPTAKPNQRAERLTQAYDRIGKEVLGNVNAELNTILTHIGQFRSRIATFESEVKTFNHKLQEGLDGVVMGFERLKDFQISVVTDFEKLDFMGKLKSLDEVVRRHRDQHRATYTVEVPPASSAFALKEFMSVLADGTLEVDLAQHVTLSGSVVDDGNFKTFRTETDLENLSSTGLTAIALIALLSGMLNVIRGKQKIYVPWTTDEVGTFDAGNFQHLMAMLRSNYIDVITASPSLTPAAYEHFAHRYLLGQQGRVAIYAHSNRVTPPIQKSKALAS